MPFAGLGRAIGGIAVASVVVRTVRQTMPKKLKPLTRRSYLKSASIQSRKMRTGQISIKQFKKNMTSFRKGAAF